jgi:predicted secreted hydrolase
MKTRTAFAVTWIGLFGCSGSSETPGVDARSTADRGADTAVPDTAVDASSAPDAALIQLPRDEAPHADPDEWWYYTGILDTGSGAPFGFEFVVFQRMVSGTPMYLGHFAITDQNKGSFSFDGIMSATPQSKPATGFALKVDSWTMTGHAGHDELHASLPGYAIDLALDAQKPMALQYGDGVMSVGGEPFYYYSYTSMKVTGSLTVDGVKSSVTGSAWMDHQWGELGTMGQDFEGWDWFSLRLDDDTEWMLYVVRHAGKPSVAGGTIIDKAGNPTPLGHGEFTAAATGSWTSPHTGAVYPQGWTIKVPKQDLEVKVTPVQADQELHQGMSNHHKYWEGLCDVSGTRARKPISGRAYVELTGYVP